MAQTWQDRCRARGGFPTVDPTSGAPACRFVDQTQPKGLRYEPGLSILEALSYQGTLASESVDRGLGALVQARDATKTAIADTTKNALPDLISHLTGLPSIVVIGLGLVVGYHLLRGQA